MTSSLLLFAGSGRAAARRGCRSFVVATGLPPADAGSRSWPVAILHPWRGAVGADAAGGAGDDDVAENSSVEQ